jgi:hypothetical protein
MEYDVRGFLNLFGGPQMAIRHHFSIVPNAIRVGGHAMQYPILGR